MFLKLRQQFLGSSGIDGNDKVVDPIADGIH
jgi:hypothetical protein